MELIAHAIRIFLTTARDVVPIVLFIFAFQAYVIRQPIPNLRQMVAGLVLTVVGLAMFLIGLEEALFPLGRMMAEQLTHPDVSGQVDGMPTYFWVYVFALAIGFSTAIAEPALLAVAMKASDTSGGAISAWGLRIAVALGAATGVALGTYRIISGLPLHWFMIAGYVVVVAQTMRAPRMMIPIAYDSGGVTTSTVTVPLVTALGLGLADAVPGRSPLLDGFGLVAFTCLCPIVAVLAYAQLSFYWQERTRRSDRGRSPQDGAAAGEDS